MRSLTNANRAMPKGYNMLEQITTQIEAFGTAATKLKASDNGKDPDLTFGVSEPDLESFNFEEDDILELIESYCVFWKLKDKTTKGFFSRVRKHIMDSKRAEYHRGSSIKQLKDSLMTEITSGCTPDRMLEIQSELQSL